MTVNRLFCDNLTRRELTSHTALVFEGISDLARCRGRGSKRFISCCRIHPFPIELGNLTSGAILRMEIPLHHRYARTTGHRENSAVVLSTLRPYEGSFKRLLQFLSRIPKFPWLMITKSE